MKNITLLILLFTNALLNASAEEKKPPEFFQLRDNLYMMTYSYPNMGILVGEDGIFLVDSNLRNNSQVVFNAIKEKFKNLPIKYVASTHSHWDHTGGTPYLINQGVTSIAQENARAKMQEEYYADENGRRVDQSKGKLTVDFTDKELPTITFSNKMTFHFNNENIELIHVPEAHTKGDTIIYFRKNNVIALGDNYFGNAYTFGENVNGMIKVYEKVLSIIDENTIIIPGHGVHSNKKELTEYLAMLNTVTANIKLAIKSGKSLEEVTADKSITKKYDSKYGGLYMNGERFRGLIYRNNKNI